MPELLNKPYPVKGEALQSYICRLAGVNKYTYRRLSEFFSKNSASLNSYAPSDRVKIAALTKELCGGVETQNLIDIWSYYTKDKELFDFTRVKLCPFCCISEKNAVKAKFWLKHIVTCDIHQNLLIDKCSSCEANITFHSLASGSCLKCSTLLTDMKANQLDCDGFSVVLNQAFECVETTSDFVRQVEEKSYAVLNQLKIILPLVSTLELSGDKYWKKRRKLEILDLYLYQNECAKFVSGETDLLSIIKERIHNAYDSGIRDLSYFLNNFTRLKGSVDTEFFFEALREGLLELASECSKFTLYISWLAQLFNFEEKQLDLFIQLNYRESFPNGLNKSIFLKYVPSIIASYKKNLLTP